ncbi:MAG TPA: hypothetical protein VGM39_10745 [Kofleriaceae bacterium]
MSIKHNGYTFSCVLGGAPHRELVVHARTERTAIEHARSEGWDVLRMRAVAGVPKNKEARTVRVVFCPGCAWYFGVRFR